MEAAIATFNPQGMANLQKKLTIGWGSDNLAPRKKKPQVLEALGVSDSLPVKGSKRKTVYLV